MNCHFLSRSIRILYIPSYYENHFQLALERLIPNDQALQYQIFTIEKKYSTKNLNELLSVCRKIIQEEQIQMLMTDSQLGQLIIAKLGEEYPRIAHQGMNFLNTLKCLNRLLMIEIFGTEECLPTLAIDLNSDEKSHLKKIQMFLANEKIDGYVKSIYPFHHQLSSFRFFNWKDYVERIKTYSTLYQEQYTTNLLSLFRIYVSKNQSPSIFQPNYLIQPFLDLVTYPHWRLVIANACIFDKEIIMWPLVDGYCGWPFLAQKPLAIMPIMICPSRQISSEQEKFLYARFRQHLTHLITTNHLHYGWIECSYFISCENQIRLISIQPIYSVYLTEAFHSTNQYGNPINALIQLANRQRPATPIVNGKTVYIHRLWANLQEKCSLNDLINLNELKRLHRAKICQHRLVRLRFREDDILNDDNQEQLIELGFMQIHGEYYENGLTNFIEFRDILLKKPEFFPFLPPSLALNSPYQFDSISCLPSRDLLEQLARRRREEQKDLI